MTLHRRRLGNGARIGAITAMLLVAGWGCTGFVRATPERWVGTWSAAPQRTEPRNLPPVTLRESTLRQILRVSIGGTALRIRLSNEFGDGPLTIVSAHVAEAAMADTIRTETGRNVTFTGSPGVTIAPGEAVTSDPLAHQLRAGSDLAITLSFGQVPDSLTGHPGSRTTSYIASGNRASAAAMPGARTDHWYVLSGIEVKRPDAAAVVVLGNSIADGRGSGTNKQNRWPDNLARRLREEPRTAHVAVLNQGMGGNCVLRFCIGPSAIDRYERDVVSQRGARWVIVSIGVNDIGGANGDSAASHVVANLTAAYARMIDRARAKGMRVYGATILPFGGSGYDSQHRERARQRVNAWIRGGPFDAVIDLDAAMRDPERPTRLRPDVDGGDHLHPNELGYRVMADAIDLALFTP